MPSEGFLGIVLIGIVSYKTEHKLIRYLYLLLNNYILKLVSMIRNSGSPADCEKSFASG